MPTIEQNVKEILENISEAKALGQYSEDDLRLICVSKYHTVAEAMEVYNEGIRDFAENYTQGLLEKKAAMPKDITWHLIGPLQSRKVKKVINEVDYFHALDRMKIARLIDQHSDKVVPCFIEVNVSGEESKRGITLQEVSSFVKEVKAYPKVKVIGLMTMAPHDASISDLRLIFSSLRQKRDEIKALNLSYAPCTELSMGMSADYPIAIQEGSTAVRVGTAFFK